MSEPGMVTILRENTPIESFGSRGGGHQLPYDLVEYGVDELIEGGLKEEWGWAFKPRLDGVRDFLGWATSYLVIDFRRRALVWDLGCFEIDSPRLVSHLIEAANPGWRAVWCPYGVESLWRYACDDRAVRVWEPRHREHLTFPDDHFGPFEMPWYGFGEGILFTADLPDGQSACWLSEQNIDSVPYATIAQLAAIAERMTGNELEKYATWPHLGGPDSYDDWPGSGVHLDFPAKTAWAWTDWRLDWDETIPETWPGWRYVEVGDCWEIHGDRTRGRAPTPPIREVALEVLGLRADGSPAEPGRRRREFGRHEYRDELLRDLVEADPSLPPTAFLRSDGAICWDPQALFAV